MPRSANVQVKGLSQILQRLMRGNLRIASRFNLKARSVIGHLCRKTVLSRRCPNTIRATETRPGDSIGAMDLAEIQHAIEELPKHQQLALVAGWSSVTRLNGKLKSNVIFPLAAPVWPCLRR